MGTTVVVGAADGPLGNLGTGAMGRGVAGLSLGTSGAVRIAVDEPAVDGAEALFCYALTESTWVVGGATSNGGGVLRWAGRSLAPDVLATAGDEGPDAALMRLAAGVPAGSEGLVMLPYLVSERAPLWEPTMPGAYLGLRRRHTRAHLVRAALEGVCMQMRGALLKGLWEAETWSLRWNLFAGAFAILAVTIVVVANGDGSTNGTGGGLAGSVVLLSPVARRATRRPGAGTPAARGVADTVAELVTVEADRGPQRRCCVRRDHAHPQPSLGVVRPLAGLHARCDGGGAARSRCS